MARLGLYLPIGICAAIIIAVGFWQHTLYSGWKSELDEFVQRLEKTPLQFGDWKGEDLPPLAEEISKTAGIVEGIQRVYRNAKGQEVQISLVCGKFGEIFKHTPDRCYPAQGFRPTQDPVAESIDTGETISEFEGATYEKPSVTGAESQRIYWSFSHNGEWHPPTGKFPDPRGIYKLYVIRASSPGAELTTTDDAAVEFIRSFVPVLNDALFVSAAE